MKKRLLSLLFLFIASTGCMFFLTVASQIRRKRLNGFIRELPPSVNVAKKLINFKHSSYYFAGQFRGNIYLGDYVRPNRIVKVNLSTGDTTTKQIRALESLKVYKDVFLRVDSGKLYLMDGMKGIVCITGIDDLEFKKIDSLVPFSDAIPFANNSFILRSSDKKANNVIVKQFTDRGPVEISYDLLQRQVDGIFCTDGMLVKIPKSSLFMFVYYYRNQILCIDSNLTIAYKGKTIDTVSYAKIKVANLKSENKHILANPPEFVNKRCSASENFLFVWSALKADNETQSILDEAAVIDVYKLTDGEYVLSFYLPDFAGQKLTDFIVSGKTLAALFGSYLYIFDLNF